jgi:circadian clock protein KaiC
MRSLCVMKSRGMAHSHFVREFNISNKGISLSPIARLGRASGGSERTNKENENVSTVTGSRNFKKSARK